MADTPKVAPTKAAAILTAVGALFLVAVLYYPPLLPVCKTFLPAVCPADMVLPETVSVGVVDPAPIGK